MEKLILKLKNIDKSYSKGKIIVNDVSLEVRANEILFLLGPSGCGKSTLLRIVAGLLTEDAGELYLEDSSIKDVPAEKRQMAMVFQNYALWPHLNVFENIAFGLKIAKKGKDFIAKKVGELLKIIQMSEYRERMTTSLSGGQQQRIALARALAVQPKLLLLDEPLSNLDAKLRESMRFEIRKVIKDNELSAIYVTHDRNEAMAIADRIAIMRDGRLMQIGSSEELYNYPNSKFTAAFLGEVNFLSGKVVEVLANNELKISSDLGDFVAFNYHRYEIKVGDVVEVAMRAENIKISSAGDNAKNSNVLIAKLLDSFFMGDHGEYTFELTNGQKLMVSSSPFIRLTHGQNYTLSVATNQLIIVEDK